MLQPPQQILEKWEDILEFNNENIKKIIELGKALREGNIESDKFDMDTMKFALDDDIWEFYAIDKDDNKVQVDWDGVAKDVYYTEDDSYLRFREELRELIDADAHEYVEELLELDVISKEEFETWQIHGSIEGLTKADIAIIESQSLLRFHHLAKEFQAELEANPHAFEKHPEDGYSVSYYSKDRNCYYRIREDEPVIHLSGGTMHPFNLEKDWHYNHATHFLRAELAKTKEDAIKRMIKEQKVELAQKVVKQKGMKR